MSDEVQPEIEKVEAPAESSAETAKVEVAPETPKAAAPVDAPAKPPVNLEALVKKASTKDFTRPRGDSGTAPRPERSERRDDKPRGENRGGGAGNRPGGENRGGDRGPRPERGPERGGDRREGGRPSFSGGGRPFDGPPADIELEKLISDSLYLDNQAHVVVMRMRDMDSGTKSQLRRLYNAVRRAVRAPESERQHQFVMLRARLAYTIARHSLRSLDALERLLLQVTRKNDARGYERFKDLFEAIVAYNE
jgi:CRISPR type III-A-associated protein Csm2